jgi:hypothetical protein
MPEGRSRWKPIRARTRPAADQARTTLLALFDADVGLIRREVLERDEPAFAVYIAPFE